MNGDKGVRVVHLHLCTVVAQRTWSPRQRSAPILRRLRDRSRPHLRKRGEAISCKLAAESYDTEHASEKIVGARGLSESCDGISD